MDSSSNPTPQVRSPKQVADEVIALFNSPIAQGNHGEVVPQIDHALQAAQRARKANARDVEVLAALLHDVGHFCEPDAYESVDGIGVADHDDVGRVLAAARRHEQRAVAVPERDPRAMAMTGMIS